MMIKEIYKINSELQQFHVKGSHPLSIDSRQIGPIAAADILGKVIWHIKTPLHSN